MNQHHHATASQSQSDHTRPDRARPATRTFYLPLLLLILAAGAYLRFEGLGVRSLWRDELATWHVSRMPLPESLKWGPELTKPPLYQLSLRLLTDDPRPPEWVLRFPAAACGFLAVVAVAWLGWITGGSSVTLAAAGLLAVHPLQIEYSQEARPYSMLMLGCVVTTALWYRLITAGGWRYAASYVIAATLTLYAHYLAILTMAAHGLWWLILYWRRRRETPLAAPLTALLLPGVLCIPLVVRYLRYKTAMFQGLEWIKPVSLASAWGVLGELGYGWQWAAVLGGTTILLLLARSCETPMRFTRPGGPMLTGATDPLGLLLLWAACAYGGLILISWIAHPALVARYALPAGVPLLLIPLIILHRVDRRAPLVTMIVFVAAASPQWMIRQHDPGLREMAAFLQQRVDPHNEVVVLTLDPTIYPGWEDSERIAFDYYPIEGVPIRELRIAPDGVTAVNDILEDLRGLWLIVLWADPFPILQTAGRQPVPIEVDGETYSQLNFPPYRLVYVAPEQET